MVVVVVYVCVCVHPRGDPQRREVHLGWSPPSAQLAMHIKCMTRSEGRNFKSSPSTFKRGSSVGVDGECVWRKGARWAVRRRGGEGRGRRVEPSCLFCFRATRCRGGFPSNGASQGRLWRSKRIVWGESGPLLSLIWKSIRSTRWCVCASFRSNLYQIKKNFPSENPAIS